MSKKKKKVKEPKKVVHFFTPYHREITNALALEAKMDMVLHFMSIQFQQAGGADYELCYHSLIGEFVHAARNKAAKWALHGNPETGMPPADILVMIDDDMVPPADALEKLLPHLKKYPIVAPLFHQRGYPYRPVVMKEINVTREWMEAHQAEHKKDPSDVEWGEEPGSGYERHVIDRTQATQEVDAVGFGMVAIDVHKTFAKMEYPWFNMTEKLGEDIQFCFRAKREALAQVLLDITIDVGHLAGSGMVGGSNAQWLEKNVKPDYRAEGLQKAFTKISQLVPTGVREPVDIIIPCWNQLEYTARCIEHLRTTDYPYNLILINNGSEDDTAGYFDWLLETESNVKVINNDNNMGFVKAVNQGFDASTAPFVMILNNDIEVPKNDPQWLARLMAHFTADVGAVSPTSDYAFGFQNFVHEGLPAHQETNILAFYAVVLKREVIEKIGHLDKRFGIGGNDDLDYSLRMTNEGYKLVIARDVFVHHEGSASLKPYTETKYQNKVPGMENVERLDRETRKILVDKWGEKAVNCMLKEYERTEE